MATPVPSMLYFCLVLALFPAAVEVEGLRCMHCLHYESELDSSIIPRTINLPIKIDPSCAIGRTPDPTLSVDCNNLLSPQDELSPEEFLEFQKQHRNFPNITKYQCIGVHAEGTLQIDGVTRHFQMTYRSCSHSHSNFSLDTRTIRMDLETQNVTGIACYGNNNCNDWNDEGPGSGSSKTRNLWTPRVFIIFFTMIFYTLSMFF
ncbi:hypothetical protein Ocin01_13123 [Orchesella cincta]|uniref:Uncharacterized protein n=1 Tax=Orchesella cincta TaxID=48709 RepID=A0A1D2MKM8_ORCCI|nr:hypothetical protein Ocin01_13123 [Orchesella cincta]